MWNIGIIDTNLINETDTIKLMYMPSYYDD